MTAPPKAGRPHIAVAAALFLCGAVPALGQADHPDRERTDAAYLFDLHVPDVVLAGERYSGVVVAREPAARDRVVLLASSDPRLGIPEDVVIPRGRNHGIFRIAPDAGASGIVLVHAAAHGHSDAASTNVYGRGAGAALALFGAQSDAGIIHTSSRTVPLLVYLVGGDGAPVPAGRDIPVRLAVPGSAQRAVATIEEGRHFAAASIDVRETGTVHARADGMRGDSVDVLLDVPEITLRVAVSPPAASGESYSYYRVWAERDGAQHVAADPIPVTMSTSDSGVARFDRAPQAHGGSPHLSYISDGIARGVIYTGSQGSAVITASAPGLGAASAQIAVRGLPGEGARHGGASLALFVHPENPAAVAWAVLSAYGTPQGAGRDAADPAPPSGVIPAALPPDAEIALAGDGGISHREVITVRGHNTGASGVTAAHAVEFPVLVEGVGPHRISAHANGMASASASFGAAPGALRAEMVPLPAPAGADAPLAILFARDHSGRTAEIPDASEVWAASDGGIDVTGIARLSPSAVVISGVHGGGEATLAGHAPGLSSAAASVATAAGQRAGISLWVPDRVHVSEGFPAALHYVDGAGAPLGQVNDFRIASEHVAAATPGAYHRPAHSAAGAPLLLSIDAPIESDIGVISEEGYLDEARIAAFANAADGAVSVLQPRGGAFWAGEGITLGVSSETIREPSVRIGGALDFAASGPGEYTAVPGESGTYGVDVTVSGDGFEPYRDTLTFEVAEKPGTVLYRAASDDHSTVRSSVTLSRSEVDGGEYRIPSGGSAEVPPGIYAASLEDYLDAPGDRGYSLERVTADGGLVSRHASFDISILGDTLVESEYRREVQILAASSVDSDAQSVVARSVPAGGGVYGYGDRVEISVPILHEYVLVRHSPLRWDGLPAGASLSEDLTAARFEALESADILVVYSRDYTALYAVLAAAALAIAVPAWMRSSRGLGIAPGGRRRLL